MSLITGIETNSFNTSNKEKPGVSGLQTVVTKKNKKRKLQKKTRLIIKIQYTHISELCSIERE